MTVMNRVHTRRGRGWRRGWRVLHPAGQGWVAFAWLMGRVLGGVPDLTELQTLRSVLELSPEEAAKMHAVQVTVRVTCFDRRTEIFFVQDDTAGAFVYAPRVTFEPSLGQRVEIIGTTASGLFTPIVQASKLRDLGPGEPPSPRKASLAEVMAGRLDSQWVEVEGIVTEEGENWLHWLLQLEAGSERVPVRIVDFDRKAPPQLAGCRIRLRGVAGAQFDATKRLSGFLLYCQSTNQVEVLSRPSLPAFDLPVSGSGTIRRFQGLREHEFRSRLQGVVLVAWPGRFFLARDSEGSFRVVSGQTNVLEPGDWVDVVGFPTLWDAWPAMNGGAYKILGRTNPPVAVPIRVQAAEFAKHSGAMIQVEGVLLQTERTAPDRIDYMLRSEGTVFQATLRARAEDSAVFPDGATLRLEGVCEVPSKPGASAGWMQLWVPTPKSVHLLSRGWASWTYYSCAAVVLSMLVILVAVGWRRRVREQQNIAERMEAEEALRDSQHQLRNLLEDRQRMSRDLHDGLIQSIYAIGLGIEESRRLVRSDAPAAESLLTKVLNASNQAIRDLRHFLLGLEPEGLSGAEFRAALKSLVLTLNESRSCQIRMHVDAACDRLSPGQARELLLIAREAITNIVRHARADSASVSLVKGAGVLRFEVEDDGCGFDPAVAPASGRGLHNMADRARDLRATFQLMSRPGGGTRLTLDLPLESADKVPHA